MQKILELDLEMNEAPPQRRRFLCPVCGKHTILWLLPTTAVKDLPVKCKRCGSESVVNIAPMTEN